MLHTPVENLRDPEFTQKYGTAPSIMDYARFNYVAQPGDEGVALMPNIGTYDKYAINWGYRPILEAKSAEDEKKILRQLDFRNMLVIQCTVLEDNSLVL